MALKLALLISLALAALSPTTGFTQSQDLPREYWDQALELVDLGQYLEAARMFEKSALAEKEGGQPRLKALAQQLDAAATYYYLTARYQDALVLKLEGLEVDRRLGLEDEVAVSLNLIGQIYTALGDYGLALKHYEEALALNRKLGRDDKVAPALNNIGEVYSHQGQYEKALEFYQQALGIDRALGSDETAIVASLNNIGTIYFRWGQYNKALENFEQALATARNLEMEDGIATALTNMAKVFEAWGQYEKAIEYLLRARSVYRKSGQEDKVALTLNGLGSVYYLMGEYQQATEFHLEALTINRKLGLDLDTAITLNNLGALHEVIGQYQQALDYLSQVLTTVTRLGRQRDIAVCLNNIGRVYSSMGRYEEALDYFNRALNMHRELGGEGEVAAVLHNIGGVYDDLGQYRKAVETFEKSVALKEKLRQTASGAVRRDYLHSQVDTYRYLTSAYVRTDDLPNAFRTLELSRAKLLAEQISRSDATIPIPSLERLQADLPDDVAILLYANVDWAEKVLMAISRRDIYGVEVSTPASHSSDPGTPATSSPAASGGQRGIRSLESAGAANELRGLLNDYRRLLSDPSADPRERSHELGRFFYQTLLQPLAPYIRGKKRLIIIPDGPLGLLPFEALVDENGRYLVETYSVSYAHSLGVLELLRGRDYPPDRKPLLAFGGAVYDELRYDVEMVQSDAQLALAKSHILDSLASRGPVQNAYASLGYGEWSPLPGTLSEVKAMEETVEGAAIFTGEQVTENTVKALSADGDLTRYKVIHFATHGLTVPEFPELSALVLSQLENRADDEDGYLRMEEIAALELQADFVNLSACETGLGRIYGGEGIVGLAQSFLIAGANGLSLSLWSVADASTANFMVDLYESVERSGRGYPDAMAETKRRFIRGDYGDEYRAPFHWAPFVYYGR